MLDLATALHGSKLQARDGAIGSVKDFYFDDQFWTIRYLIADTGTWMTGRAVLISPYALEAVHLDRKEVLTSLTRAQVEKSPSLDSDKPVSRQFEENYYGYYGWPSYWGGPYMWGTYPSISRDPAFFTTPSPEHTPWDPHLRSMAAVKGYTIQATDGEIGHVEDFIVDDDTWSIRYLVIKTGTWLAGKKVFISPSWIDRVSWEESKVFVHQSCKTIRSAPEYSEERMSRDYESSLYNHYGRPGYWEREVAAAKVGE